MKLDKSRYNTRTFNAYFASVLSLAVLLTPLAPVAAASSRLAPKTTSAAVGHDATREGKRRTVDERSAAGDAHSSMMPVVMPQAAPIIAASKTDNVANTTQVLPGGTINYTVTITNNGTAAATGVNFADTLDVDTTLTGVVNVSPLANPDTYNTIGNTLLEVGVAASGNPAVRVTGSVFDNDTEFLGDSFTLDTFQATSTLGGTVSMVANGQFSYLPPVNQTGVTDTFTYTIEDGAGLTSTSTVSITIANRVWYVNNAVANGDGRSSTPFNTLASVAGVGGAGDADSANDIIYVFTGTGNYTGGIPLENGQSLIGNGVALVVNTIMLRAAGMNPTIINAGGNGVTLAQNNTLSGFTVGNSTGSAISGTGFVTVNVSTVTINTNGQALALTNGASGTGGVNFTSITSTGGTNNVSLTTLTGTFSLSSGALSGATSHGFAVDGSAATINYSGTITNSAARAVSVINKTGGTVALSGAVSGTSQGVFLNANTGAAINFTGGLSLSTGANPAFTATGGGTVSATQDNTSIVNTLTTTTGIALNVTSTNIGASGLTFRSISANGGANGIVLNATGTAGGLTVTGNSSGLCGGQVTGVPATVTAPNAADCTGGVIQNTTGAGILLTSTSNVSLTRIRVANGGDDGVFGTTVTGFTLASSLVESNGNAVGEAGLDFDNLHGTSSISNSAIRLSHENNVEVRNTVNNGSLATLSITGSTINNNSSRTQSDDGVLYQGLGTSNMSITVSGCALFANRGDHLQATTNDTGDMVAVFQNNTLTGGHSTALGQDIVVNTGATSTGASFSYDINGNSINGAILSAITATLGAPSVGVTMSGMIRNNLIGTTGVAESGSVQANGITINQTGGGTLTTSITNNQIRQWEQRGISASAFNTSGTLNLTIQSNTILEGNAVDPMSGVGGREAIIIIAGSSAAGDTNVICAQIGGAGGLANNVNRGPEAVISGESDIRVRARSSATFRLPGYGGTSTNDAAVAAFIAGMNTSSVDGSVTVAADRTGSGVWAGGAACAAPAAPESGTTDDDESPDGGNNDSSKNPESATGSAPQRVYLGTPNSNGAANNSANGQPVPSNTTYVNDDDDPSPSVPGAPINVNIGTLGAGQSVTITFSVTVDNPFPATRARVSNQGTVSGTNFSNVLTDDPELGGANDPTITNIPPQVSINDAAVGEPPTGSVQMPFTVVLAAPSLLTTTINYTTAMGGANPATAGSDYTTTSASLVFAPNQTVQTVSVPVLADGNNAETDETFLVNLTLPVGGNGNIVDAQATGTIRAAADPAGTILISELRTSGPMGANDEFVEIYNNTDAPVDISGYVLVKRGTDCTATPVIAATIPGATMLPARAHYLITGSTYSLAAVAASDLALASPLEDDVNVALFSNAALTTLSTATRLDAVGFGANTGNNCDLLREGANLGAAAGSTSQYSFVREFDLTSGLNVDTNNNAADFTVVSTTPLTPVSAGITAPTLGAPGPEGSSSPINRNSVIPGNVLDPGQPASSAPNRIRTQCPTAPECNPTTAQFGTMQIRRNFTNTTNAPVTQLRFRVIDITGFPRPDTATADMRVLNAPQVTGIALTGGGTTTAEATTLQAPMQPNGGGLNSTVLVGVITMGAPLNAGETRGINFQLGVQQRGYFRYIINVEAIP